MQAVMFAKQKILKNIRKIVNQKSMELHREVLAFILYIISIASGSFKVKNAKPHKGLKA